MTTQTEAVSAAQSYSFTTAQAMQDLYKATEAQGRTPTAYVVDGDMTVLRAA